jgi:hypothetical protein
VPDSRAFGMSSGSLSVMLNSTSGWNTMDIRRRDSHWQPQLSR